MSTPILTTTHGNSRMPTVYLVGLGLVITETAVLSLLAMGQYQNFRGNPAAVLAALGYWPILLRSVFLSLIITVPLSLGFFDTRRRASEVFAWRVPRRRWLGNVFFFALLAVVLVLHRQHPPDYETIELSAKLIPILMSPLLWLAWLASVGTLIVPDHLVKGLRDRRTVVAFVTIATAALLLQLPTGLQDLGGRVSRVLTEPTLFLVLRIFSLIGETVQPVRMSADGFPQFGIGTFYVEMHPSCAGLAGVMLMAIILTVYFVFERGRLKIWQIIAIIAGACGAMFVLNALRIALLMSIGAHWSPDVAVNGFHTHVSMVFAAAVSLLSIITVRAIERSNSEGGQLTGPVPDRPPRDPHIADLIPLGVLLGVSLLTGSLTGSFFWLYPVHIAAAAIALFLMRGSILPRLARPSLMSIVAGIAAFVLWMAWAQHDPAQDEKFGGALTSVPAWVAGLWIVARFIGAVLIVPLAEELAFRGGLWDLVRGWVGNFNGSKIAGETVAWVGTSVAFGLLHGDLVVATIVGGIYGALRLKGGGLSDVFAAHAATNLMLALYVLHTSQWSYW